jgi:hypothetical protein
MYRRDARMEKNDEKGAQLNRIGVTSLTRRHVSLTLMSLGRNGTKMKTIKCLRNIESREPLIEGRDRNSKETLFKSRERRTTRTSCREEEQEQ